MDQRHQLRQVMLLCTVLVVVTLTTFWPVLHCEFINYDDPDYVTENAWVKGGLSWDGVKWAFTTDHASNWHPVTWLSHMADVSLFGMKPSGHHGTNLLFHVANSALLLLLLYQMTGAVWRSAIVAALFALHPLHVESVAWVAERKDVLSTFFGLLCLMAYARYSRIAASKDLSTPHPALVPVEADGAKWAWYVTALLLLALGLMSKPMLVTWPFVMLLLDLWPLKRVELSTASLQSATFRRLALEKLPFLALVAISCIVTVLVQAKGGAVTTAINLPLEDRLENAVVSYLQYLTKTIWPTDLAIFYPHPETRYPLSEQWPLWAIGLAGLLLFAISILVLRRARQQTYLAAGWFWYLGTLVPVIGIVQVGAQAMADRYTYIPLIGIFIALVWFLHDLTTRFSFGKPAGPALALVTIAVCVVFSRNQITYWQNSFTIFSRAVDVTRNNAPAHGNLGTEYVKRGELEEGIKHFQAALEADPHFADAAYNLGLLEQNRGNLDAAAAYYRDALQRRPDHVNSHHNLAVVLWLLGNTAEAELQFQETLQLRPDHLEANANLGNLLLALRRPAESQTHLSAALQIKPDYIDARLGLGLAFKMQGQFIPAEERLRQVVTVQPDNLEANLNLGVVLSDIGQTNEAAIFLRKVATAKPGLWEELAASAITLEAQGKAAAGADQLKAAVCLNPDKPELREHLARLQAQCGSLDVAAESYEIALTQRPSAESHYYLGAIRALQGNAASAVTNFRRAVELKPEYLAALNELAWILATHPDEKVRNGKEAVQLAEQACKVSGGKEARYWGTLDAALAEAGRFPEAIQAAEKTRRFALATNQPELAAAADTRLIFYQLNKPYRQ